MASRARGSHRLAPRGPSVRIEYHSPPMGVHQNFINGEWAQARERRPTSTPPTLGCGRRVRPRRRGAGARGDRRGARRRSRLGARADPGARRHARPDRQRDPGAQGRARHAARARGGQDHARGHRRGRARRVSVQVLRRRGGAPGGRAAASVRPGIEVEITREPVGVVGIITPWNFPIAIPAWKIAPALAYGNCVVFKPADLVPGCAWALAEIICARRRCRRACSTWSWAAARCVGERHRRLARRRRDQLHRLGGDRHARRRRPAPRGWQGAARDGRQEPAGRAGRRRPRRRGERLRCRARSSRPASAARPRAG